MRLSEHERRLVEQARPTVEQLARQAKQRFAEIPFDDFISTGNEAAVEVAHLYDASYGVPFDVFAFKRIRGAMLRKTPREVFGGLHIMIKGALSVDLEPAPSELSMDEALEDSPEQARSRALAWAKRQAATMLIGALEAATLPTDDRDAVVEKENRDRSAAALSRARLGLTQEEQYFLDRFYRDGAKFDAIASELGVVKRTVTRMHERIKAKLCDLLRAEGVTGPPPMAP